MSEPAPEPEPASLPAPEVAAEELPPQGAQAAPAPAPEPLEPAPSADGQPARSALQTPGWSWAWWGLLLALGSSAVAGWSPQSGLGFWLDDGPFDGLRLGDQVLRGGAITLRRVILDARANEFLVTSQTSLGAEVVALALYLVLGALAGVLLARRAPELLRPRGGRTLRQALTWLTPLATLIGVGAALLGPRLDPEWATASVLQLQRPALVLAPSAALFLLRFVLVGPLAEELIWRGVVYGGLRARLRPVPAAVLCALGFALWHLLVGWRALAASLLHYGFSLLACAATERTGSLWTASALHVLGNGCAAGVYALVTAYPSETLYVLGLPR